LILFFLLHCSPPRHIPARETSSSVCKGRGRPRGAREDEVEAGRGERCWRRSAYGREEQRDGRASELLQETGAGVDEQRSGRRLGGWATGRGRSQNLSRPVAEFWGGGGDGVQAGRGRAKAVAALSAHTRKRTATRQRWGCVAAMAAGWPSSRSSGAACEGRCVRARATPGSGASLREMEAER
jgi:hypothetical protein